MECLYWAFVFAPADTEGIGGQINWLVRQLYIWAGSRKKPPILVGCVRRRVA